MYRTYPIPVEREGDVYQRERIWNDLVLVVNVHLEK